MGSEMCIRDRACVFQSRSGALLMPVSCVLVELEWMSRRYVTMGRQAAYKHRVNLHTILDLTCNHSLSSGVLLIR